MVVHHLFFCRLSLLLSNSPDDRNALVRTGRWRTGSERNPFSRASGRFQVLTDSEECSGNRYVGELGRFPKPLRIIKDIAKSQTIPLGDLFYQTDAQVKSRAAPVVMHNAERKKERKKERKRGEGTTFCGSYLVPWFHLGLFLSGLTWVLFAPVHTLPVLVLSIYLNLTKTCTRPCTREEVLTVFQAKNPLAESDAKQIKLFHRLH